ncbi:MAG: AraC family transcriptional regulator, partial [bacterium]
TWDVVWILVSVFMYLIGYMGLRQPVIFSGDFEQGSASEKTHAEKYKKSTLTPTMAETFLKRLLRIMAEEKPHLQNDLTLPLLAKKLSISTHHLSQVINEKLQQNLLNL